MQTEDSGIRHPHIITHLFMDGGRILKTTKTSYAEYLGQEDMGEIVRKMMKEQHKAMFMALRNGEFDEIILKHFGSLSPEDAQVSHSSPAPASEAVPAPPPSIPSSSVPPPATASSSQVRPSSTAVPTPPTPSAAASSSAPPRPSSIPGPPPAAPTNPLASPVPPAPSVRPPSLPPISSRSRSSLPGRHLPFASELPHLPPNVLNSIRPEGNYREVRPEHSSTTYRETGPVHESGSSFRTVSNRTSSASGRHAVARPSLNVHQPLEGSYLFGDDVSEKSLDEVILSYLAEDLEPPQGNNKK